jgi:hypothetical protein
LKLSASNCVKFQLRFTKKLQQTITFRRLSVVSFITVTTICLGATLCAVQTINITGRVKVCWGAEIAGASVKMVKANITATTGLDGILTIYMLVSWQWRKGDSSYKRCIIATEDC